MQILPPSGAVSDATFNFTITSHFYSQVLCLVPCTLNRGHFLNNRKSIFCFLALFSMPSQSLFIVCSSNSPPKSDIFTSPSNFLCEGGVILQTRSSCIEHSGLKASTNCGHQFWNNNYSTFSLLSIINMFWIWDSMHSCECAAFVQAYHHGHTASTQKSGSTTLETAHRKSGFWAKSMQMCASCRAAKNLWSSAVHDENQAPEKGNPKTSAGEAESCLELVPGKDWAEEYTWISTTFLTPEKDWRRRHLHCLLILSQEPQTLSWGCSWRTWTGFPLNVRQRRRRKRTPA